MRVVFLNLSIAISLLVGRITLAQTPLGMGFTYQGEVQQNGNPVDGTLHLRFSLWDAPTDGNQIGFDQVISDVPVAEGVFTVTLNEGEEFGASPFNRDSRWLQIEICDNAACDSSTTLNPRQPLTATPYSLQTRGIFVDPAGKVGIGSATPHHQLRISGGPAWTSSGWTGALELDDGAAIAWNANPEERRFGIGQTSDSLRFFHSASDPGTVTAEVEHGLVINRYGQVGIGPEAATPTFPLQINPGHGGYGWVHTDGEREVGSYVSPVGCWLGSRSDHPLHFFTNDSLPQVTLSTAGNLGIGTSGPTHKLEVANNAPNTPAVRVNSSSSTGIVSISTQSVGIEGSGQAGVLAIASGPNALAGLVAVQQSGELAARFDGKVDVLGELIKSSGSFRIDHPLDPQNKYLSHSFVESPDMMNVYNGNVILDDEGAAEVTLPDWFMALNKDFRYQLTPIGGPGPNLHIAKEIDEGRFSIGGGSPGMKVSWQVTGIRQDAWAKAHPIEVEELKSAKDRGKYIHHELFGQPEEKGIHYRPDLAEANRKVPIEKE